MRAIGITAAQRRELDMPNPGLKLKWPTLLMVAALHVGVVFAPFTFSWPAFWVFFALQGITAMGITLGYHRLLTHRSFQTPKWFEYAITLCGSLAFQNGPLKWVATHRVHHAFADRPQDPHSPNRGFWWAHMLWLFAYDEVLDDPVKYRRYVPELLRDPVHRYISRTDVLQQFLLAGLLFAAGGWPFVVWGTFVRIVFVYHGTWLVNSAAHVWGYRWYETGEGSRNNWWVALITYGEGWHNNHHAYPSSAAHGLRWWELDATYLMIRLLAAVKIARKIHLPRGNPAKLAQTPASPWAASRPFAAPRAIQETA
jgi:stearoyl-CoA desaturase (delta-9 desaturase)